MIHYGPASRILLKQQFGLEGTEKVLAGLVYPALRAFLASQRIKRFARVLR